MITNTKITRGNMHHVRRLITTALQEADAALDKVDMGEWSLDGTTDDDYLDINHDVSGVRTEARLGSGGSLYLLAPTNTSTHSINFGDPDDANPGRIEYGHQFDHMYFRASDDIFMWTNGGGKVGIGAFINTAYLLTVNGAVTMTDLNASGDASIGGQVFLDDGTTADPALSFTSDTDLRLYRSSANVLGIAASSVLISAASPSLIGKNPSAGACFLSHSPQVNDGTSLCRLGLFRHTSTTNTGTRLEVYKGDGTNSITSSLRSQAGSSYLLNFSGYKLFIGSSTAPGGAQSFQVTGESYFDDDVSLNAGIGLHGVTPPAQASHISDPSGGSTVDTEARSAINDILVVLEDIGATAAS